MGLQKNNIRFHFLPPRTANCDRETPCRYNPPMIIFSSIETLQAALGAHGYLADRQTAVTLFLAGRIENSSRRRAAWS